MRDGKLAGIMKKAHLLTAGRDSGKAAALAGFTDVTSRSCLLVMIVACLGSLPQRCQARITNQEIVTMTDAHAVAGGIAQLPCDVEPPVPGEKLQLVIWYKEGTDTPIYSFDSRGTGSLEQGMHWQDPSLNGRGSFSHAHKPATLRLESVRESDAGLYRCRVDFRQSPTRNSKVNLTVIIPPEQLSILDEDGRTHIRNYILGPYSEGSSLNITCVATGGRPQPRVTWWRENALLDDSYETVGVKRVRNVLQLEKLERKHLLAVLTCQASNNNMVAPISSSVSLNMTLKPLWVRMLGENRPLSAGTSYELSCEVIGARPTPEIVWTKGNTVLRNARQISEQDGNVTTGILTFVPSIEDAGKFITCRGGVSEIPGSALEDSWKLDIHHQPVVSLELGSNLNASAIREGTDVYFECNIRANPWVYKVFWQHNGNPLYNNAATGTIVSNQSLVLQSVSRQSAGVYTCIGSNQEGDGRSNPVNLDIKYAPVCHQGQTRVFGVARQETIDVTCELEANPPQITFAWKFNNTMEAIDIAEAQIAIEGMRSVAAYTPMTELDYGTLLCWGSNEQGTQIEPCVYHVVPAGRPDTPQNCTVLNRTTDSLRIECAEGFDGGLPQRFTLELETEDAANTLESRPLLVHNRTEKEPSFAVRGLTPGSNYRATIFASNGKGRSEVVRLGASTLNLPERRTGESGLAHPPSPENCTIREESRTSVKVSCAESEYPDSNTATYVLQVFDAGTRHLLASATSLTPNMLEVTDLPPERSRSGLVLFLRIMTAHAMSNATVLQSQRFLREQGKSKPAENGGYQALTPVMLSLSGPLLGAIVAASAGLLLVVLVIVLAVRLRYRPRNQDRDKDSHDDGGMSNLTAPSDKSVSSIPAGSASADSFDEKDPDVIPHTNENAYTELSVGTWPRYVLQQEPQQQQQQQRPESTTFCTEMNNVQGVELAYAELALGRNRRVPPNCYEPVVRVSSVHRPQLLPMSTLTRRASPSILQPRQRETPTVYARVANMPSKPIYATPPPPHPYRTRDPSADETTTAETPLIECDYEIPTIVESTSRLDWRPENLPPISSATTT